MKIFNIIAAILHFTAAFGATVMCFKDYQWYWFAIACYASASCLGSISLIEDAKKNN